MGSRSSATATEAEAAAFGQSVKDWPAFPDSAASLAYLKQHYKLAILSNVDRASFAHSARKLGQAFDLVVTAQDVGSYKPALKHFEVALAKLASMGIEKHKILHTAQSLFHDHVPAKKMGLTSFWIDRRAGRTGTGATKPPPEQVTPDWTAPSLAAMVEMHRREIKS
jgi:2-haloalkanoic acid dehalogenase type II